VVIYYGWLYYQVNVPSIHIVAAPLTKLVGCVDFEALIEWLYILFAFALHYLVLIFSQCSITRAHYLLRMCRGDARTYIHVFRCTYSSSRLRCRIYRSSNWRVQRFIVVCFVSVIRAYSRCTSNDCFPCFVIVYFFWFFFLCSGDFIAFGMFNCFFFGSSILWSLRICTVTVFCKKWEDALVSTFTTTYKQWALLCSSNATCRAYTCNSEHDTCM